jgi:P pilus assembly chaperone PapD
MRVGVLTAVLLFSSHVLASLQVFPVVLEMSAKDKTAQLTVRHTFSEPRWVEVASVYYEMTAEGSMVERTYEDGVNAKSSAIRMLRFSPKRFLLKPGESQIIRVRGRIPSTSEDGIYRAHLKFTPDEADEAEGQAGAQSGIQQQLRARIAIAVPVYLQKGETNPQVQIKNAKLERQNAYQVTAVLELLGADMVRGDLYAYAVDKKDPSQRVVVGKLLGVATYVQSRKVALTLFEEFKLLQSDSSKKIELEFKMSGANAKILATQSVDMGS